MMRKALLPAIAAIALSGCATYSGYGYDDGYYGAGDYYYGRSSTGYGSYGQYGYDRYGNYGYYDRYGRFVVVRPTGYSGGYYGSTGGYYGGYGYPGGYYGGYGYPRGYYGYGGYPRGYYPNPPRPRPGDKDDDDKHRPDDDRRPLWRRDPRRLGDGGPVPRMNPDGGDQPLLRRSPGPVTGNPRGVRGGGLDLPQRPVRETPMPRPMAVPQTNPRPAVRQPSGGSMGGRLMREVQQRAAGGEGRRDSEEP